MHTGRGEGGVGNGSSSGDGTGRGNGRSPEDDGVCRLVASLMQHDAIPADLWFCWRVGKLGRGEGRRFHPRQRLRSLARSPVRDRFLNFSRIVENRWLSNNRDKTFLKFEQILQNRIEI